MIRWTVLCVSALCATALLGAIVLSGMAAWYYPRLPALDRVTAYQPAESLQVFTRDEVQLAQFGAERRQFVPIAQMPTLLKEAVVATEDVRFREHGGIDVKGVLRALVADLTPGAMRQGASTITQQVARTFFLSSRVTAERKIKEALLALEIEHRLTKDQILELYLNQIYLGHHAYGMAAAAEVYFGKPLSGLSVAEIAMLAGLPQNPVFANPIADFQRARERQMVVLQRMLTTGLLDPAQFAAARDEKLVVRSALDNGLHAEYVAEMVRQTVHDQFGDRAYTRGLRVYTSLLARDQQAAYQAVRHGVIAYERKHPYRGPEDAEDLPEGHDDEARVAARLLKDYHDDEDLRVALVTRADPSIIQARLATGEEIQLDAASLQWARSSLLPRAPQSLALHRGSVIRVLSQRGPSGHPAWTLTQWPEAEAAFVALDPATGHIRAMVGGFDFHEGQFNHVTQGWRQPGSSFKPFLYSEALEHGVMPATLVQDGPLEGTDWQPRNSEGEFDGPLTLRQGLARSKNLVSVRLLQHVGVPSMLQAAQRFGFDGSRQPDNLTLALGAGAVTPLQLAAGYAVFANGGHKVEPVLIERITDSRGNVLYQAPSSQEDAGVISARNAFITQSLLGEVTRVGTAARVQQVLKRPDLFGKTGTTNDAVDAWFAGYQPSVVAVAWMGYDQPRSLGVGESGGGLALPIWIDYMRQALKDVPVQEPVAPEGLVRTEINGIEDWAYAEPPAGGFVAQIGVTNPVQPPADTASAPGGCAEQAAPCRTTP